MIRKTRRAWPGNVNLLPEDGILLFALLADRFSASNPAQIINLILLDLTVRGTIRVNWLGAHSGITSSRRGTKWSGQREPFFAKSFEKDFLFETYACRIMPCYSKDMPYIRFIHYEAADRGVNDSYSPLNHSYIDTGTGQT